VFFSVGKFWVVHGTRVYIVRGCLVAVVQRLDVICRDGIDEVCYGGFAGLTGFAILFISGSA
jgi:hypothetical protein